MKKFIVIGVIVALIFCAWLGVQHVLRNEATLAGLTRGLKLANDTATKYKDLYSSEHARIQVLKLNHDAAELLMKGTIDSQAKRLQVKPKQITEHSDVGVSKNGYIEFTMDELDSIIAKYKVEQNSKLPGVKYRNKMVYIPYADSIDLKLNKFWKRSWFLGNKKWYVDVYSEDTAVKVYKFKNVAIADEYGPFAISLTGGVTVPNLKPVLVVGVSYTPNFLRFKKRR